jgi:hypothetical protein
MPVDKDNKQQAAFLKRVGGKVEAFLQLLDVMPDTAAYLKDRKGRIMFLNWRNCENCNVKEVSSAIGKTSYDLFLRPARRTMLTMTARSCARASR